MAPFYLIVFGNLICQDNSSGFSSIMPDEFGEHLTLFIHTESLQIHQIPSWCFSSSVFFVQVRGLGCSWQNLTFMLILMFVLNHCPDRRPNHGPLYDF